MTDKNLFFKIVLCPAYVHFNGNDDELCYIVANETSEKYGASAAKKCNGSFESCPVFDAGKRQELSYRFSANCALTLQNDMMVVIRSRNGEKIQSLIECNALDSYVCIMR